MRAATDEYCGECQPAEVSVFVFGRWVDPTPSTKLRLSRNVELCALIVNWFCGNPSENTMPLKFIVAADLKGRKMKCEHRKMKVMMGAVIAGAQELGVWDEGYRGAWDVPRAMRRVGVSRLAGGRCTIFTLTA
jgi:hypothetical protein